MVDMNVQTASELGEQIHRRTLEDALAAGAESDHGAISAAMSVQMGLGSLVERLLDVPEAGGQRNLVLHYLAGRLNR